MKRQSRSLGIRRFTQAIAIIATAVLLLSSTLVLLETAGGTNEGNVEKHIKRAQSPSAPILMTPAEGNAGVFLRWTAPSSDGGSPITNYRLYRGIASHKETVLTTVGDVFGYNDTNVRGGVTYYYTVSSINLIGEGAQSTEVSATPPSAPSAPTLYSIVRGNNQVALAWTAPGSDGGLPICNYKVYRGTTSGEETPIITLGNVMTYTDTGLANGQTYYYKASAVNPVGESSLSIEASATPASTPTNPQSLSANGGNAQIALIWSAPASDGGSAITAYRVYRGNTSGGETTLVTTTGNVLTYTNTGLANGQTYYYRVSALNAIGEGAPSSELSAMPINTPSAPLNLRAASHNGSIALTWQPPNSNGGSAVIEYEVWRGASSGAETLLADSNLSLSFNDTGLTNGQSYYYFVKARNAQGLGPGSNEVSATPSGTVVVPTAPQALTAASGNGQIVLSWSAPSSNGGAEITNYNLYAGATSGGETLFLTLGNLLAYICTGLTNGQTYYYMVSAVNSAGEGPQSNEISTIPATTPSAPTISSAAPGNAQIALTWTAPSSNGGSTITGYNVYRGTSAAGESLQATIGNVFTYKDSSLANGQTYYYKISAVNSIGEGPQSSEASATPFTVPSAPQNFVATAGSSQVTLTWMAPSSNGGSSISGYKVYRGTASGSEAILITLGNVLTYVDTGLASGQTYYYKISALNSAGEGVPSREASIALITVPSAPMNLVATAGNTQIALTWSAPSSNGGATITAYRVYRGTTSGGETILATLGNVLTYSDAGLVNGQMYYYKVIAVNSAGGGLASNEVGATPQASHVPLTYTYLVASSTVKDASGSPVYTAPSGYFGDALNWAVSHANATVYVPAGHYTITTSEKTYDNTAINRINLFASGATLFGDGPNSTVFTFAPVDYMTNTNDEQTFTPINVDNVTLESFGITGCGSIRFWVSSGTHGGGLVEDVTISNTLAIETYADHYTMNAINAFSTVVSNGATVNGMQFIRCTAFNVASNGFGIYGQFGQARPPTGVQRNILFEDCKAEYCGYTNDVWDWTVGFDLNCLDYIYNVTLIRCNAMYNWESGFYTEWQNGTKFNVKLIDCNSATTASPIPTREGRSTERASCSILRTESLQKSHSPIALG